MGNKKSGGRTPRTRWGRRAALTATSPPAAVRQCYMQRGCGLCVACTQPPARWRPCTTCMRTSGRSASPPPFPVLRIGAATVWPCAQCRAVRPVTLGIAAPRCGGLAEFLRAATRTCLATEMELVKTTLGRNLEVQNYAHAEQCSDLQQEL